MVTMVTGNEYIFDNIDQALEYVLEMEQKTLAADIYRSKPPIIIRPDLGMHPIPVDSLDYPLGAWFNNEADDKFVMTRLMSGRYSLKPNLSNRKILFRGESEFHNPCKPNLFRNNKKRFTAELARGQEMMLLMLSHPLVQLLDLGVELCGEVYRFEMNLFGLTQHYYNKTSLIDLTSDPMVAAFFATAKHDDKTDTYSPIVDENHEPGVLYYYNLDINTDFGKPAGTKQSPLSTIGLQVFPRSGKQKGFLYDMRPTENFNEVAQLNAVRFHHDPAISRRICAHFHDGKDLFPDDILMKQWKNVGWNSKTLSSRTVKMNHLFNPKMTLAEVDAEIRSLAFDIKDYIPSFTNEELEEYYDAVKKKNFWDDFCNQIHIPGDKLGNMMKELLDLPNNPKYRWAFERDDNHVTDYNQGFVLKKYKTCLI